MRLLKSVAVLAFILPLRLEAQTVDAELWTRHSSANVPAGIPWVTATYDKLFIDERYSFDVDKAVGSFVGLNLKRGALTFQPAVGAIAQTQAGGYGGYSAELYTYVDGGNLTAVIMNQYTQGKSSRCANFVYHWTEALYRLPAAPSVSLGIGEQYGWGSVDRVHSLDIGPVAKVSYRGAFLKAWPSTNMVSKGAHDRKIYIITGYATP